MDGKSRVSRLARTTRTRFSFAVARYHELVTKPFFSRAKKKALGELSPVRDERSVEERRGGRAGVRRDRAGNEARVNATRGIKFGAPPVWRM